MAGLVPAIHVLAPIRETTWMPGLRPGMTRGDNVMSLTPVSIKPKLVAAEPQLFVADIKASCEFFTRKLGFSMAFTYGEPPYYAQVKRDGARLNLRCVDRPAIDSAMRDREELLSASLV